MTIKLKDLLNESALGEMPSDKLMKMKWNPVTEAGIFDTGDSDSDSSSDDPGSNAAVKKFDALLKGKPAWEKIKELITKLSDVKQSEFFEYMMNDAAVSDTAKKKLKLKL